MKTAEEIFEQQNPQDGKCPQWAINLANEFADQFKYDYSKNCNCKDSTGSTWCCNLCGLPTTSKILST